MSEALSTGRIAHYPYAFFDLGRSRLHETGSGDLLAGAGFGLRSTWQIREDRALNSDLWVAQPLRDAGGAGTDDVFVGLTVGMSF